MYMKVLKLYYRVEPNTFDTVRDDSSQTVLEHHRYHLYTISICVDSSRTVLEHHRHHLPIYFLISFFLLKKKTRQSLGIEPRQSGYSHQCSATELRPPCNHLDPGSPLQHLRAIDNPIPSTSVYKNSIGRRN